MIDLKIKQMFFDRRAVTDAVSKERRAALSRAGAFIRQTARQSIRTKKGSAPPGKPPHAHTGLIRKILFGYDPATESVVIGPVKLNKPTNAPNLLEFGGRTTVERRVRGRIRRRRVSVRPRPFMGPALRKELPKLPRVWANSIRGG